MSVVYNFVSCPRMAFRTPRAGLKRSKVVMFSQDKSSTPNTAVPKASPIPDIDEDREVMHASFLKAFEGAQPERAHIAGMMEFAGAILSRAKIPSQQYVDPLMHIFDEFDRDKDGSLSAKEVAAALRSRGVEISDDQAAMFISVIDLNDNSTVERSEFRDLILHMAAADLHNRRKDGEGGGGGGVAVCSWEQDDEVQDRLKAWTATLGERATQMGK